MNQIAGTPSLGASYPVLNIVNTPLTNQMLTLPLEEQYSFIFRGNSQILDHCLTTDLDGVIDSKLQFVRANADNHENFEFDTSNPLRVSDHDGFVFFMDLGAPVSSEDIFANLSFKINYENPFQDNSSIILDLEEANEIQIELTKSNGQIIFQKNIGQLPQGQHTLNLPTNIPNGFYFLKINGKRKIFVGKMMKL